MMRFACLLLVLAAAVPGTAQPLLLRADTKPGDAFGVTLALAPPYVAVGAPGDDAGGLNTGAVYVFRRQGGAWVLDARLKAPGLTPMSRFGTTLALDGTRLAVGAAFYDRPLAQAGRVFLYERTARGRWTLVQAFGPPLTTPQQAWFGGSVALQGHTLLIRGMRAAPAREGVVFVYTRAPGKAAAWTLHQQLTSPRARDRAGFGTGLLLEADTLLASDHHTVHRFVRGAEGRWRRVQILNGDRVAPVGALARQGAQVLAGLHRGQPHARGRVQRLRRQPAPPLHAPVPETGGSFGWDVAAGDTLVAVGAPQHPDGDGSGVVYVYDPRREPWTLKRSLSQLSGAGRDAFGAAVALHGRWLLVGAPNAAHGVGAAYLYDLSRAPAGVLPSFAPLSQAPPLSSGAQVEAMLQDEAGWLWLGGQGLHLFDGYTRHRFYHDPADTTSLSHDHVLSLLRDRQGRYWVGTEDGLNRFDRATGRFRRYPLAPGGVSAPRPIRVLFEARDGTVWTGTNGRLYRYEPRQDRFVAYAPFTGLPEALGETYVSGIQQDRAGHLWVLAKNLWAPRASLYRIDLPRAAVTRYVVSPEWGWIGPFLIDRRDRFWLKAPAPVVFPADTTRVLRPAVAPVPAVHWTFFEDGDGTLWIGTGNGFYRLAPGATRPVRHTLTTSEADLSTSVRAFLRGRDGALLVGTDGWAYRAATLAPSWRPPVVLTRVQVNSRAGTRTLPPFDLRRLRLSHRDDNLTLEFAALDYHTARAVRYRYRLDGFDGAWVDAGDRHFATYTHVPPGRYVFRAEALPAGHATPLALPVQVVPAFWQTAWFRGLVALALVGLATMAYRWRVARLLEVERLRIRIAGDLHDDFSSDLSGIALATELVARRPDLSDRDRRQLRDVRTKAVQMIERLRDVVWYVNPEHDHLHDLVLRMRHTAATLLPEAAVTFDLPAATPHPHAVPMAARRDLFLVYKEALHNVARHARAQHVHVCLAQHGKRLVLEVRDDGRGFAADQVTPGHGLKNMRARATQIRADFRIESRPGGGTVVRLTV